MLLTGLAKLPCPPPLRRHLPLYRQRAARKDVSRQVPRPEVGSRACREDELQLVLVALVWSEEEEQEEEEEEGSNVII